MTGFLTVGQAAKRLAVSRQTIHQMMKDQRIRGAIWMLERWAIPEVEIERVAHERAHDSEPEPQAA